MREIDEMNQEVAQLIDGWCERRATGALRSVLPAWPHNGLTDGFADLANALRSARALAKDEMTELEVDRLSQVIAFLDQAVIRESK